VAQRPARILALKPPCDQHARDGDQREPAPDAERTDERGRSDDAPMLGARDAEAADESQHDNDSDQDQRHDEQRSDGPRRLPGPERL
jgi:hypothetical protein